MFFNSQVWNELKSASWVFFIIVNAAKVRIDFTFALSSIKINVDSCDQAIFIICQNWYCFRKYPLMDFFDKISKYFIEKVVSITIYT